MAEQHGKALVPQIRFSGFTDPWEQRKLCEIAAFGGGHTPSMSDPDNYEGGNVLWVTSQDVKSYYLDGTTTQITEKGAKELTLYPMGALVMVTRSGILRHTLPVAELCKPSTVNQDIRVILPQEDKCCGKWLLQFFISRNKELLLEFGKTGTTVESVDFSKMKDMILRMPSLSEQRQIGLYFARLDNLITLHQRKYDKLCVLKKSMLDKMFPKGGSLYPEIRFAGFTDPWEQRKLGELFVIGGSGGTPSATNASYYGGDIPFLGISDIKNRDITITAKSITEKGLENSAAWIIPAGSICLAMYASVGKAGINRVSLATSQAFYNMVFEDETLRDFIYTRLEKADTDNEWNPLISTGTQANLNADKVKSFRILLPSSDERRLIAKYFADLDSLITLHQRKLELLRNIKKSMLDKMFV